MRIHSDTLTGGDLSDALSAAGLRTAGVWIETADKTGSRTRDHAFTVKLAAEPREGRRRQRNTGTRGAEEPRYYRPAGADPFQVAATWDEHGRWMAELFEIDPAAVIMGSGRYDGREDFHAQTDGKYRRIRPTLDGEPASVITPKRGRVTVCATKGNRILIDRAEAERIMADDGRFFTIRGRLEYLREQIRGECISMGEIAELQGLAEQIDPGDVELLEWAGVPEYPEPCEACGKPRDPNRDPDFCPDCLADMARKRDAQVNA